MELPIRAMNRNEVSRFDQSHDQLQLFFAGMAAHMDGRLTAVRIIDLRAPAVEVIHHAADRALVAGNLAGRKNDGITLLDLEILVIVERQPRQRRHRLALASAGHDADLLPRIIPDVFRANDQARWNFQKAEFLGQFRILRHSSSEKADNAAVLFRLVHDKLKPRNRRRETGKNDPAL